MPSIARTACTATGSPGPATARPRPFLFPRPRDYRPGIFKFTSTNPVNAKPTRADLRKTILYGLHGTSMPGFEAIDDPLGDRAGHRLHDLPLDAGARPRRYLIDEAMNTDDKDAEDALADDVVKEIVAKVTSSWKDAETQVVNPTVRRVDPSPESIKRGRDLFLGANPAGAEARMRRLPRGLGQGERRGVHRARDLHATSPSGSIRSTRRSTAIYRAEKEQGRGRARTAVPRRRPIPADAVGGQVPRGEPAGRRPAPKNRGLMAEVPDKDFAEKLKADLPAVVAARPGSSCPTSTTPTSGPCWWRRWTSGPSRSTTGTTRSGRPT